MKTCIFQLYAPMVSWGEIAVGGTRRSAIQPSRSAILGLLAAALGIKRESEEKLAELANSLSIAIRIDASGTLLTDYQTIQVPKKEKKVSYLTRKEEMDAPSAKIGTILSSREYRCDAYSLVAIYSRSDRWTLEKIVESLRHPKFHVYLGRKSAAPALPLAPRIVEANDMLQAFEIASRDSFHWPLPLDEDAHEWKVASYEAYAKNTFQQNERQKITRRYYWEDGITSGIDPLVKTTPYDKPISRDRWQFKMRNEYMAVQVVEPNSGEGDNDVL